MNLSDILIARALFPEKSGSGETHNALTGAIYVGSNSGGTNKYGGWMHFSEETPSEADLQGCIAVYGNVNDYIKCDAVAEDGTVFIGSLATGSMLAAIVQIPNEVLDRPGIWAAPVGNDGDQIPPDPFVLIWEPK